MTNIPEKMIAMRVRRLLFRYRHLLSPGLVLALENVIDIANREA